MANEKTITNNIAVNGLQKKTVKSTTNSKKMSTAQPLNASTASSKKSITTKSVSKKASAPQKKAVKKVTLKVKNFIVHFQLKFKTSFGQNLFILGNHPILGDNQVEKALPMQYFNEEMWVTEVEFSNLISSEKISYNYILKNADGTLSYDLGADKYFIPNNFLNDEIIIKDVWNFAGYYENAFYTEPFKKVLFNNKNILTTKIATKKATHIFKIKAPLLEKGETICLLGSSQSLKLWNTQQPLLLHKKLDEDFYSIALNLSKDIFPIAYKFGIYNTLENKFKSFEKGNNRVLYDVAVANKTIVVNDGFAALPALGWKGAGMAIPVFSIRTHNSFGAGEFTDLKLLVDWSKKVGLKLIQLLPVNDTTATHTWLDSYPYAAISAFALHPLYLNIAAVAGTDFKEELDTIEATRVYLNNLPDVDYAAVMEAKLSFVKKIFPSLQVQTFASSNYQSFFQKNKHWLVPYAVFCYLRDLYGTSDFNQWPAYTICTTQIIAELTNEQAASFKDIAIHYFIQYHLHLQLTDATAYAHQNGIILKGDIAIGVYRYGADAWQQPELYHMHMQAGAPPDDFAVKGQNWGFPTYNWQRMKEEGFAWWKLRFEQMSYYFDAFRIDHILGFFRIWSIPTHAVQGIMGYFVPSIPINVQEFYQRNIWYDYQRYTKPYITDEVLFEIFGYNTEVVKQTFLDGLQSNQYVLKEAFNTQQKVEKYFNAVNDKEADNKLKNGLFDLISNVILFEVEGSEQQAFHFRFAIESTLSFKYLDQHTQTQLKDLYINYFFRRQDDFWMKEALQKLPALKRVTNMLICGEDLGLVPDCVPEVMRQLGLLSLEIQRMPKNPQTEFFHPNDAPYLSVVTPSTHDMSTIRGWWEEDREKIQRFYNVDLGQQGQAPLYCEAWINKNIVLQHLYSPAMWCIFQIQDLLGMDEQLRRKNPNDERINIPSNPKNYWKYRMHLSLEDLLQQENFNAELNNAITASGR